MTRFRNTANWDGVDYASVDVGARKKSKKYVYNGYYYATRGEMQLAALLTAMKVPFSPDIPFWMIKPDGLLRLFVPDFVFDKRPFIWYGRRKPTLIHGIEAKGKTRSGKFSERALENVRLLENRRGIRILLLSNGQIKQYFNKGRLPLKPFDPAT